METHKLSFESNCPLPLMNHEHILLGHGSGGKMSADLLRQIILPAFGNEVLNQEEDQAILPVKGILNGVNEGALAFTTDSFVINPIFFPGGDIGKLAINGTLNDLAVGGVKPLYLSSAFILEEGLSISDLKSIAFSMRQAADEAGVTLVTGDTKVVEKGKGDKIFITTSGIGFRPPDRRFSIAYARPGDRVLISGSIGDHGIAILSVRAGLEFGTTVESDTASLYPLVETVLELGPQVRCMRDPTRGGIASTLNEIALASKVGIRICEEAIPIKPEVKAACEILGLDPMYIANEGKLIAIVSETDAEIVLASMKRHPLGKDAAIIGEITPAQASRSEENENRQRQGWVTVRSILGGERVLTLLAGEQLPRIC